MKKITYEELTFRNSPELHGKLIKANVGIAGCGGLGSNAALALGRIGIGKLVLVDYDKIEPTNLNRQQYSINDIGKRKVDALEKIIKSFNPFILIEKHIEKLTQQNISKIFGNCHLVIEAFDLVEHKSLILKAFASPRFREKYLIMGNGLAGFGASNKIKTKKLTKNIFICGDNRSDFIKEGVMAPRVMLTAAHQANLAVELLNKILK